MTATPLAETRQAPGELSVWLAVAEEAAGRAGRWLRQRASSGMRVTAELARDVKLSADREAEARILDVLRARSDVDILSEECGAVKAKGALRRLRWVVDPLDGSLNYLHGIPFCGVSVGLWDGQEPVLGAVYDFTHEEMFTGMVGQGAWLNGRPIHASDVARRERAILATGFPVSTTFSRQALGSFIEQVRAYKKVRLLGSAAVSLCYVAAGRVDAYLERDIQLWDVAAGLAIVRGAGGRIAWKASRKPGMLTVYAGNTRLSTPW